MTRHALRDVTTNPAGEPYYPPRDLPPGRPSEIPIPPVPQTVSLPSEKGTRVSGKGPVVGKRDPSRRKGAHSAKDGTYRRRDVAELTAELDEIAAAGLSEEGVFLAQLIWAIRNMLMVVPATSKPLPDWAIADIISLARGVR